jgi:hypothetical protein
LAYGMIFFAGSLLLAKVLKSKSEKSAPKDNGL